MRTYTKEEVLKMVVEFAITYNTEALALDNMNEEEQVKEVEDKVVFPE
jgi:hypothetical protein